MNSLETKFEEALIADGFSAQEVAARVLETRNRASGLLREYGDQCHLHTYLHLHLTRKGMVEVLPFLLSQSPSSIDVERLMQQTLDRLPPREYFSVKEFLRYLEVWGDLVSEDTRTRVLERILATEDQDTIALYAAKLLKSDASNGVSVMDAVQRFFEKSSCNQLPLFSSLPFSALSPEKQAYCWEEPSLHTDDIVPCRRVDRYVDDCSYAEESHGRTLLGDWKRGGNGDLVLLYVRNDLVGSMKMDGEPSILGVRTVEDSQGRRPLVIGGIYATTSTITHAARHTHDCRGRWARLDVVSLPLLPLRLLRHDEWSNPEGMCRKLRKVRNRIEHPSILRRIGRKVVPWLVGY